MLIEILVVLPIIAALAALLMRASVPFNRPAKIPQARTEINSLIAAITAYQTAYSRFPTASFKPSGSNDFTFGTFETGAAVFGITNASGRQANNSEVIAALMDLTQFGNGNRTPNTNHSLNPQQTSFLAARMTGDTKSPGVGLDGVYRDPWGNPYIITVDFDGDGRTRDAFYCLASVSERAADQAEGLNSLVRPTPPPYNSTSASNSFEAKVRVMVWSLGPDGKADASKKANEGVNKDNILIW